MLVVGCTGELWDRAFKGGYIKDCQDVFRQLRSLAKVAHRGRHGTSDPAVAKATPTAAFTLLALQMRPWRSHREQGRQNTDGGERSVTPGHGSHNKSPLLDVVEVLGVLESLRPFGARRHAFGEQYRHQTGAPIKV